MYCVAYKKCYMHVLGTGRSNNWKVSEMISLDRCSERWSCWILGHSTGHMFSMTILQ